MQKELVRKSNKNNLRLNNSIDLFWNLDVLHQRKVSENLFNSYRNALVSSAKNKNESNFIKRFISESFQFYFIFQYHLNDNR